MIALKKSKRIIRRIIIHCTATREGEDVTVEQIRRWHTARPPEGNGWKDIGYHYVIYRDGSVHEGRDVDIVGAHTKNYNGTSIGIVYVGGLTKDGKESKDTRTPQQREALKELVREMKAIYPDAKVHGHNEFAKKDCPCFNVRKELAMFLMLFSIMLCSCTAGRDAIQHVEKSIVETRLTDTVVIRDSVLRESTTLIREVDSAQMAEFGIRMRNDMKAFLVQQNQKQNSHKESSQIREIIREKHDTVYLINDTPVESGKKRTFRDKMEDVICSILNGAACIFLVYIAFIVILNRKKIGDFWRKIWKSRK